MSRDASDEGAQGAAAQRRPPAPGAADRGRRMRHGSSRIEFALSRRQAYRYLEQAAALSAPVPAVEPTVAITFKLPVQPGARAPRVTRGAVGSRSGKSSPRRSPHCSAPSRGDVAERHSRHGPLHVQLDYAFDRLRASKLAHAYELLVPARARPLEAPVRERGHADGSDLRAGLVGATTRGAHDCEPDGGADRVGEDARSGGADRPGSSKTKAIAAPRSNGPAWSGCAIWRRKARFRPCSSTARIA